jgi:hypothetical protein
MSKTITLNLNKALIFEAVKADSFDTARIEKVEDPVKLAAAAAAQQGGEDHQERQMLRYLKAALGKFEALMSEFVDVADGSIEDTLSSSQDVFTVTMIVNDRYNNGLATPMSSLCEDYLVNQMLYDWWRKSKPEYSKNFVVDAQDAIDHIRLCLAKTAPSSSSVDYTDVTGTVTQNQNQTDNEQNNQDSDPA